MEIVKRKEGERTKTKWLGGKKRIRINRATCAEKGFEKEKKDKLRARLRMRRLN